MMEKTHGSAEPAGKTASKPQQPSEQDVKANTNQSPHGALTDFRQGVREFTFGVLRPESGLVGEKTYETSFSQTMENLSKEHIGALTGFHNKINGFAFGIMRPETGVIGETLYDSSHSITMDNLSKEHIGAAAGIKNTLRQYARAAVESTGPPVQTTEPVEILQHGAPDAFAAAIPQDTQRIDTTI
jgi:hypothetical protein